MNRDTEKVFVRLFGEAFKKCFDKKFVQSLSEAESKLFCVDIQEKTGLVLSYKSIKNYSLFVLGQKGVKNENPSLATLDTLARYVLNAPVTSEPERKKSEDHYPYWYLFYKKYRFGSENRYRKLLLPALLVVLVIFALGWFGEGFLFRRQQDLHESFNDVTDVSLASQSWKVIGKDAAHWEKRDQHPGFLTLFTLRGDNWPDTTFSSPGMSNLVVQPLTTDCFSVEAHLQDFFPKERWQQAGIIILEDTTFTGRSMRMSVSYNDFFGGFDLPPEILVQGVTSKGIGNPEEFLTHKLFRLEETSETLIQNNLQFCRLRIEATGKKFRFLLAHGPSSNAAFKEIGQYTLGIEAKYVGIFAIKGNVEGSKIIPVKFDAFKLQHMDCD